MPGDSDFDPFGGGFDPMSHDETTGGITDGQFDSMGAENDTDAEWPTHELGFGADDLSETIAPSGTSPSGDGALTPKQRLFRGFSILVGGTWNGAAFGWRDRATVFLKLLAAVLAAAAASSLLLEATGFHPEWLWNVEVIARQTVLGGIEMAGGVARYALNHEWVVLLVALLVISLYRR